MLEMAPQVLDHVYWHRKEEFQLPEDQYAAGVCFAVTEGRFVYGVGEDRGEAGFGDLVFCPPRTLFRRRVLEPLSFHFYWLHWRDKSSEEAVGPRGKITLRDHTRLASTYHYLQQLPQLAEARRSVLASHALQDLWQQHLLEHELAAAERRNRNEDPQMAEAEQWLREHACGPVVLRELGAGLGCSAVQFTRRFQAATGLTPMDFLTAQRLKKARKLLLESHGTLDEIAAECGYENGFYLSRIFTRKMGMSPSAYRREYRV